jgi:CubicO group peptidase (beta-lactamase class C family)
MKKHSVRSRTRLLAAGTAFVSLIAAGIYLQPGFSSPSLHQTGDATVASFLTPLLKGSRGSVAAAFITPRGVQYALWNSDYAKQYEIASLTKTMTSSLLIEAQRRGEATAQTRVGELVPEITGPASEITLEQLASHRSGLPPLATSLRQKIQVIKAIILRDNFWNYDDETLIEMVNTTRVEKPAVFDYSNTGYALLGLALARASHQSFATLLHTRVFAQAQMKSSVIADDSTPVTPHSATAGQFPDSAKRRGYCTHLPPPREYDRPLSIWQIMRRRYWQENSQEAKRCRRDLPLTIPIHGLVMPGLQPAYMGAISPGMTASPLGLPALSPWIRSVKAPWLSSPTPDGR